jgi:type I restriction enzyme S subunit
LAISGKLTSKEVSSEDISGTFVIPSDWKWCTLSEIAACRGSAKAGSDGIKPSDWILDMEDIDGATGTVHTRATFKERSSLSTKSAFKQGDVLYGKLRPYLNKVVLADSPGFCTTEIIPITPGSAVESRYLQLALRSPYFLTYVAKRSYGMKMPRLGTKDLESSRIPLPPLAEQKRIVAKVDELMALCDRLEAQLKERDVKQAALAKAALAKFTEDPSQENLQLLFHPSFSIEPDDLRKLVLNLAIKGKLVAQDPDDEPEETLCELDAAEFSLEILHGWIWTSLAKLAEINGGFAFKSTDYTEEGIRVVRISDFDEFGFKDHKIVRHAFSNDLQRFTLEKQNILMAMTGGTVGKSYFVRTLPEPMVVNQRVATIKVYDSTLPSYIDIVIRSEMTQAVIRKAKNSTNDNISMGDIKGLRIPVPPLAEQRRIVEKVEQLMTMVDALETQLDASRTTGEKLLEAMVAELTRA